MPAEINGGTATGQGGIVPALDPVVAGVSLGEGDSRFRGRLSRRCNVFTIVGSGGIQGSIGLNRPEASRGSGRPWDPDISELVLLFARIQRFFQAFDP